MIKERTLADYITDVPDFPKEGILFRDITTLLNHADGLALAIDQMVAHAREYDVEAIAGLESRGFLFGVPVAYAMHLPFIPIRKAGKLPRATYAQSYDLEYGQAILEVHRDAVKPGTRVMIIDDLIATGGTAKAAADLMGKMQAEVVGFIFLLELLGLQGRRVLANYPVTSLVQYE